MGPSHDTTLDFVGPGLSFGPARIKWEISFISYYLVTACQHRHGGGGLAVRHLEPYVAPCPISFIQGKEAESSARARKGG